MRTKPIDNELVETAARSFLSRGIVPTTPQIQDSIGFGHAGDIRPILLKFLYAELSRLSVEVLELRQGRGGPRDRSEYGSSQSASTHEDMARLSDRIDTLNDHLNHRLRDAISAHEEERMAHEATRRDLLAQLDAERARADRERDRCQVLSDRLIEIIGMLAPKVAGDPNFTIGAGSAAALFAPVGSEFSEAEGEAPPFEIDEDRRPAFGLRSDTAPARPSFDRREDESLSVLRGLFADDDLGDEPEDGELEEDGEALVLEEAVEEDEGEDDTESEDEDENDAFGGGFGRPSAARGHPAPEPRDSSPEDDIAGILARLRAKDDRPPPAREPDYSQLFDLAAQDGGASVIADKPPEKPKRGFFRRG